MLEQVAWQVANNQQNIHILHTLLFDLKQIMNKYYCWGRPLGSTILWEQHLQTVEKICQMANTIEIKEPINDGTKRLTDLPEELIRQILLRLSNYKDLMSSGQAYKMMNSLLDEQHIWKQLCKYHFAKHQVRQLAGQFTNAKGEVDHEQMFHFLRRKFGLKEEFADTLLLCRHCRYLFWKSIGHPCVLLELDTKLDLEANGNREPVDNEVAAAGDLEQNSQSNQIVPEHIPVPPQAFLKFFSL
ncbi:F-box only protein 32 [Halotydeus destructor]|nr:F-box only protein 32 [Halotydeus destructor]